MQTVTVTKILLDKEERAVRKTWSSDWPKMRNEERRYGKVCLLFGNWSGYNSSQARITHTCWVSNKEASQFEKLGKGRTVRFTDNTTMNIWITYTSIENILRQRYTKYLSYSELISKVLKSGKTYYEVGKD